MEKTASKMKLKAGNNILKLMGKANQAKKQIKQEIIQIQKDPIFALPKLPPNTDTPSIISTYCQILINDELEQNTINQNPLNIINNNKNKSENKLKIRHSSLSFFHESEIKSFPNKNSNSQDKNKYLNQVNALTNKYSFLEITQNPNVNYFIEKIFEPEIALFMNGANKVISVISQQKDSNFKKRIDLSQISNYIIKTNRSLEAEKQRTYDVKFVEHDCSSFELSENVNFLDSSISIITPNSPPFSYLFVLNLIEENEIMSFSKIIHQLRSLDLNPKSDINDAKKEPKSSIITSYSPFRQICQICKKNCSFSIVLFLCPCTLGHVNKAEKLANMFCEKKKSFFTDSEKSNPKNESILISQFNSDDSDHKYENGNIVKTNNAEDFYADDSGDNYSSDISPSVPSLHEDIKKNDQDFISLIIDRAESEIEETERYVIDNTVSSINSPINIPQKKEENISEDNNNDDAKNSSLFELLKKLNNSEKENKEKLEKIGEIQKQLQIMKENISTIKSRKKKIKDESEKVNLEIEEIQKQTENQVIENEQMKKNVREMITRTSQLKSKYNDLLTELHDKERNQREQQLKIISEKQKELRKKVAQSETKWRKELENRKNIFCIINEKENQNLNEPIDPKIKLDQTSKT